jgi:hypothetical protein
MLVPAYGVRLLTFTHLLCDVLHRKCKAVWKDLHKETGEHARQHWSFYWPSSPGVNLQLRHNWQYSSPTVFLAVRYSAPLLPYLPAALPPWPAPHPAAQAACGCSQPGQPTTAGEVQTPTADQLLPYIRLTCCRQTRAHRTETSNAWATES